MTNPIDNILPRDTEDGVSKILHSFSETIDEFVNFGTHVLKWHVDIKRGGDEQMPLIMFLRELLEKADSISILVKNSSIDPAKTILRSLFELHLYISYLLESHFQDRSMAFLVWNAKNIIKTNNAFLKGNQEYKNLKRQVENDNSFLDINDLDRLPSATPIIDNQEALLQRPEYKKALTEYEKTKKRFGNPKWYSLFNGPQSIQGLAIHLKMSSFYELVYRNWSGSVHSTDIINGKIVKSQNANEVSDKISADIIQIRLPKDAQSVSAFTLVLMIKTYSTLINTKIPDKKVEYTKWYLSVRNRMSKVTSKEQLIKIEY
ncbi:MAG: hypothetical protein JXR71_10545 [Bacteroidales bacterium]|nr:hypothetical protein [Bacteroidales bacterium]